MPAVTLKPEDLAPFATIDYAKAEAMIEDALGLAELVAPCIVTDEFKYATAAKAILRGAVLRWDAAGAGVVTTQNAGPYQQVITPGGQRRLFWPSEIDQLQAMCRDSAAAGAFAIDTAPMGGGAHSVWCSLLYGGDTCSCGIAVTAGREPVFEPDV